MYDKIIRGLASGAAGLVITLTIQVISAPIFTNYWGVSRYAEWLVLLTIPSFLAVSDFGFVNVFSNYALKEFSRGEYSKFKIYIGTAACLILPLSLIISLLFTSFISFYSNINLVSTKNIFILVVIYSSLVMISSLFVSIWRSINKFATGSILFDTTKLIEFFSNISLLYFGFDEVVLLALLVVLRIISLSLNLYLLSHKEKLRHLDGTFSFSKIIFRNNFKKSVTYFLIPLSNMGLNQGVIVILSNSVSPSLLVFFNTSRVLIRLMNSVSAIISNAWRVDLTRCFFDKNEEMFRKLYVKLNVINISITSIAAILYLLFGEYIYNLWMGDKIEFNKNAYFVILFSVVIASIYRPYMMLMSSLNKHETFARTYPLIVVFGLSLISLLGKNELSIGLLALTEFMIFIFLYLSIKKVISKNEA